MFARRFFAGRFFAPRFWPAGVTGGAPGVTLQRFRFIGVGAH